MATLAALALAAAVLFLPATHAVDCYESYRSAEYPFCAKFSASTALHWRIVGTDIIYALDLDGEWDWVGLGLSEGGMLGADITVVQLDPSSQTWSAADYFAARYGRPALDEQQDVQLVAAERAANRTRVTMRRPLHSCDTEYDQQVLYDTAQVLIHAYGRGPLAYHGPNRGQLVLKLRPLEGQQPQQGIATEARASTEGLQSLDLLAPNYTVPTDETTYMCINHEMPSDTKYHIVYYEAVIEQPALVHHFVVYSCASKPPTPTGQVYNCLGSMPPECEHFYIGWGPGIDTVVLPPEAGMPFGAGTDARYVVLQIHYSNVEGVLDQVDTSGLRVYYTPSLRPNDAAVMVLGSYTIAVPPGAPSWSTVPNLCPAACTRRFPQPVTLMQSMYHMHMAGRSVITRHIRNGTELPPLGQRKYYDFDVQAPVDMPPETRTLLPGDELITTCTYSGVGRTEVTRFGQSTYDEMCYNFLVYWPKVERVDICMDQEPGNCYTCGRQNELAALRTATQDEQVQAVLDGNIILKGPTPANLTFVPYNQSAGCAPLAAAVNGLAPTPSSASPSPSPSPSRATAPGTYGGGRPAGSAGKPSGASGPKQGGGTPVKGPKKPYSASGRPPGRAQLIIRGQ